MADMAIRFLGCGVLLQSLVQDLIRASIKVQQAMGKEKKFTILSHPVLSNPHLKAPIRINYL